MQRKYTKTYHIIFDAFSVSPKLLNSEQFVLKLLLEVPKLVGMKILTGPHVVRDYDKGHEGITGFAIIDFSHISIHTFVRTREAFVDIFSCKPFDYKRTRNYLYKNFKVKKDHVETLEVKYPWE
ncbi:MAG: S-adenosylmethionine decarboxylase [Candidatus Wildermuthbacteria bacterium]|nr:S-adenosylmethionine decarboxylase [Candidatus Wildermuthbacteria bacterium]